MRNQSQGWLTTPILFVAAMLAACGSTEPVVAPSEDLIASEAADTTQADHPDTTAAEAEQVSEQQVADPETDETDETESSEPPSSPDLLCGPSTEGQAIPDLRPPWTGGTERTLEVEISKSSSERPIEGASLTRVNLLVQDAPDGGWSFDWQNEPTSFDDLSISEEERAATEAILDQIPAVRVEYRLGNDHTWLGVDNADELRSVAIKTIEVLSGEGPGDAMDQAVSLFENMSDEQIGQALAIEPQLYHLAEGLDFSASPTLTVQDVFANPLGGSPFPGVTTMELDPGLDSDGCITVRLRSRPDPEQYGELLVTSLKALSTEELTEADLAELEAIKNSAVLESTTVAQLDPGSGFFRRIIYEKFVEIDDQTSIDLRVITDVTAAE